LELKLVFSVVRLLIGGEFATPGRVFFRTMPERLSNATVRTI
jgi:hypothetical protein